MKSAMVAVVVAAALLAAHFARAQSESDPASDAAAATAAVDDSSHQDLVLCTPLRPLLVRLQITIDGQGFRQVWREYLGAAYDSAARATGGTIEVGNADAATGEPTNGAANDPAASPAIVALAGAAAGYLEADAARHRTALAEVTRRNGGRLPREEALDYLVSAQPAFSLIAGSGGAARGPALFPLLDADADGHLTPEELTAADARLSARDFNDDEIVTEVELAADPANAGVDLDAAPAATDDASVVRSVEGLATAGPLTAVEPGAKGDQLAALLLARYDRDGDGRIRCDGSAEAETTLSAAATAALDADGDGAFDAAELARFAARAPDLELKVSLGRVTSDRDRRRRTDDGSGIRVKRKTDGSYDVRLGEAAIDLRRNNRDPAQNRGAEELRMSDYDRDGNQYLEPAEVEGNPTFAGLFALDDADGDGKIVQGEFRSYAQRLGEASASRVVVEVFDRGQELFVLLDADRDAQLTPRELRSAAAALDEGDADGDGRLGSNEVPQQLRLELSRGTPQLARGVLASRTSRRDREGTRESRAGGPRWFQKMDRNGDGDVSRREFLGPADLFPRVDADGDGLIDRREAEAAEEEDG